MSEVDGEVEHVGYRPDSDDGRRSCGESVLVSRPRCRNGEPESVIDGTERGCVECLFRVGYDEFRPLRLLVCPCERGGDQGRV